MQASAVLMAPPSARTRELLRPVAPLPRAVGAWAGPVFVYGALSLVAVCGALSRGQSPIAAEAWLPLGGLLGHVVSVVAGIALAFGTIKATRHFVKRWGWARALHVDLRPAVRHAGEGTILVLGIASAASEELFFRGLLATTIGLIASSLAFGLLHQMRGRVRWVWAAWATVMGFLFGALFLATGSLLGPLLAHAVINVANLRFIRDTDVEAPKLRRLGGLL
ncbi:MAG: protease family protein [Myxococcales bacterium]|nr:protease family protein [Myxococcales bacterium]